MSKPLTRHARSQKAGGRRLREVLAGMREGYAEMDDGLRFVLVNHAVETLFHQPADHILGQKLGDLLPEDIAVSLENRLQQVLDSGTEAQFEHCWPLTDNRIELRIRCKGEGLALFLAEITDFRNAERALRQETERWQMIDERFKAALSVTQLVVFKIDRNLRYLWGYNNQVGVSDQEGVGKTPLDFFDPPSAARLIDFFQSVMESGEGKRTELALRPLKIHEDRYFVTSAKPLFSESGEVIGLTGASVDITPQVRQREELANAREEAFIATAEAERASLSKSKFLAAASHDLRQPVQSLLLLIEVLKTRLAGSPVKKAVDQMEEAVNALRLLFDSMLDISRLDAGVIVPVLQTVSLDSLLGRLADEYRLRAEHLSLDFRLIPTSVHVRTDPVLIERVLRNLLENALRYCPSGRVLVGCRRKKKMVRIDVVDTGIGIAADHLDDIFEEFHQVANAARDRSQGLGLGLSIVKRIMRLLDGTVSVRSTLGRGSRFSITLPVAHQLVTGDRRAIDGTEGAEGLILIIEDDALLRDSLEMMLRNWGYRTMSACLGEEALAKIEEFGIPDAVIADYRLSSGLTGIETVLRLSETTGQLIPSLIITGDTAPERVREVHGSGLRIMHKPVAADELRRALLGMISIHSRHSVETLTDTKTQ